MRLVKPWMMLATIAALVAPAAWAGDDEVAQQVASRIVDSGKLTDYEVGVKVKGNVAWLTGRVRNQQQMQQAMTLARSTPSISKVVNRLQIGSSNEVRHAGPQMPPGGVERVGGTPRRSANAAASAAMPNAGRVMPGRGGPMQASMTGPGYCPPGAPGMGSPIPVAPGVGGGQIPGGGGMGAPNLGSPMPMYAPGAGGGVAPVTYDQPSLPNYAWPSYAAYPNYAAVTYPRQYSPTAWPFIGPFYPYPQVPLGWRKVTLEWDDGWWWLDFKHHDSCR
ncbi:MAG: BON domain-containing protein [Planctomycetaceae bacterium]|nr:BON domain-containing protein [Planctomycetaceae bacterium]